MFNREKNAAAFTPAKQELSSRQFQNGTQDPVYSILGKKKKGGGGVGGREDVFWQTADTAAGQGIGGATSFRRRWRRNRRNMACSKGLNCQRDGFWQRRSCSKVFIGIKLGFAWWWLQ